MKRLLSWQQEMDDAVKYNRTKRIATLNLLKEYIGQTTRLHDTNDMDLNDPTYWENIYAYELGFITFDEMDKEQPLSKEIHDKLFNTDLIVVDIVPKMAMMGGCGVMICAALPDNQDKYTFQWSSDFDVPASLVTQWLDSL